MSEMAIQVKDLSKVYKLYNKPSDRLKETLGFHVDASSYFNWFCIVIAKVLNGYNIGR